MELQAEYLRKQHQRRAVVLRVAFALAFVCLFTAQNIYFSLAGILILFFWNFCQTATVSKHACQPSDTAKIAVKCLCAQLHVLSGSPFGWTLCLAASLFEFFIFINPYHENYKTKLLQIQQWAAVNTLLTLLSMRLAGADYCVIAQAVFAMETTRFVMTKIYDLHSPLIFKLHHTNEEKSAFISVVSHEIRTPLTHIINSVELLEEVLNGSEILQQIQRSSDLLLRLINKILNYSKWKAQKSQLDNQVLDIRLVFRNIIDQFAFDVTSKGIFLNYEFDEAISQYFLTDKLKIEELFLNLVGNSVKFTHQGGVTVSLKMLVDTPDTQILSVSIADTGIGISKEALKTLFLPFSQADKKISSKYGGFGLGLAICQEIAKCLKGTITVQSKLTVGTTISVTIPFSKASPVAFTEGLVIPFQGPEILFCEDNVLIRKVIKQLLHKEGFKDVAVRCDGVELVEAFKTKMYKIVVTDQHMPNMDGGTAVKLLKETYPNFKFKAILLTADVSFEMPWYIDRVLTKPTNGKDLKRAIEEEYQKLLIEDLS